MKLQIFSHGLTPSCVHIEIFKGTQLSWNRPLMFQLYSLPPHITSSPQEPEPEEDPFAFAAAGPTGGQVVVGGDVVVMILMITMIQ